MRVVEIFRSIQGEGRLTGVESLFVRASGCNLRCGYCDTPYASWEPEGKDFSIEEIVAHVEVLAQPTVDSPSVRHVVLTGGEPMLFAELIPLCAMLHRLDKHITIETAGTLYLPVECDLMSISPKLANSNPDPDQGAGWLGRHERNRRAPDVIRRLNAEYDCQFKFVVDSPDDCREVLDYLADFPEIERHRVMLMPQGTDKVELAEKAVWLESYCTVQGLVFCPRRHIEWFGSRRGT